MKLNSLLESVKRLEGPAAPVQGPELITVRREDLHRCVKEILEYLTFNGGGYSQLADKCLIDVQKYALI